jgi:hypothetical protein
MASKGRDTAHALQARLGVKRYTEQRGSKTFGDLELQK